MGASLSKALLLAYDIVTSIPLLLTICSWFGYRLIFRLIRAVKQTSYQAVKQSIKQWFNSQSNKQSISVESRRLIEMANRTIYTDPPSSPQNHPIQAINQLTYQSNNQPANQVVKQSSYWSLGSPFEQSADQSISRSIDHPIHQITDSWFDHSTIGSDEQSIKPSLYARRVSEPYRRTSHHSANQSFNQSQQRAVRRSTTWPSIDQPYQQSINQPRRRSKPNLFIDTSFVWIDQKPGQIINQTFEQLANMFYRPGDEPVYQSNVLSHYQHNDLLIDRSNNQSNDWSTKQSPERSIYRYIDQSTNQFTNQTILQTIKQSNELEYHNHYQ